MSIDNIVRDYLWKGGKAKIAYNILQLPKQEGGLNLVNLLNRDKALKTTWPQILSVEEQYAKMVYGIMRCKDFQENIWRAHLKPEDVKDLKIENEFWRDVLKCWCEFNYYQNFRTENQVIWYNSCIKREGKVFFWRDAYERGLTHVYQMFEAGHFRTDLELQNMYGLSVMRINSLKKAIPKEWRDFFCKNESQTFFPVAPHNYDLCVHVYKGSIARRAYAYLAEDAIMLHNKYIKWTMETGIDFCGGLIGFRDEVRNIYRLTNVTKYRSFQYRLMMRGLVTNIQLEKWGIKTSETCSFCQNVPETVIHVLWQCAEVQRLWNSVFIYFKDRFNNIRLEFSMQAIITNHVVEGRNHVINFLCLVVKQFIYAQKCLGNGLHFPILKNRILQVENIEKYIAVKNDKLGVHLRKWIRD